MKHFLKISVFFALAIALGASALYRLHQHAHHWLESPLPHRAPIYFSIDSGDSFGAILAKLAEQGIVSFPWHARQLVSLDPNMRRIQAGEYAIPLGISPKELLNLFVSGSVFKHRLTLIEGWSFREAMAAIAENPAIESVLPDYREQTVLATLNSSHKSAEGLLMAETWHFPKGTTDLEFLQRAHRDLVEVLDELWQGRAQKLPYESPYDALIVASLIEKETALAQERPLIAGVFVRRLLKGMKLQTDPTVIFAMGNAYQGNIRKKDLSIDSPYNTYLYAGLPPSPIAIVGRAALKAALHPADGDSLYFVSKGDGSHYFSATLREHNQAVFQYQIKKH
ncbi:MAG: endolytic transglycosylase MltG [Candidatus Eutrophobiaceae bacterium]